jgi:AraC-like DNA-binding protein
MFCTLTPPAPPKPKDPTRSFRHVRNAALGESELSYVRTTAGAAPPDVRAQLEIILVDKANKTIVHRGVEQRIRTGMVGIRSPYEAGRLVRRHASETRVRLLTIGDQELRSALETVGKCDSNLPQVLKYIKDDALFAAAHAVFVSVEANEPAMAIQSCLASCAIQVVRTLTNELVEQREAADKSSAERIREALRDRIAEDVTLDDLAREIGLSRTYVVHAFRRVFQLPPYEYLMHLRVAKAREMLAAGERPIDVAHACGFCDQSHMNRWFRADVGVTPGEYGASKINKSQGQDSLHNDD